MTPGRSPQAEKSTVGSIGRCHCGAGDCGSLIWSYGWKRPGKVLHRNRSKYGTVLGGLRRAWRCGRPKCRNVNSLRTPVDFRRRQLHLAKDSGVRPRRVFGVIGRSGRWVGRTRVARRAVAGISHPSTEARACLRACLTSQTKGLLGRREPGLTVAMTRRTIPPKPAGPMTKIGSERPNASRPARSLAGTRVRDLRRRVAVDKSRWCVDD
jgi:hypothetical protein